MSVILFKALFLAVLCMETLWELFLIAKNIEWVKARASVVPPFLKGKRKAEELEKAALYSSTKGRFALLETLLGALLLIFLVGFDGFSKIDNLFSALDNTLWRTALFVLTLMIGAKILSLPFTLYYTFVIEERFGFNKTTLKTFFTDRVKSFLLSLALTIPLILGLVWFIKTFKFWWFYTWLLLLLLSLIMMVVYPTLIAPLFNKFTPLEEGSLSRAINDLAQKCGFSLKGVKVMDASRRSGHSNAYFTGLGKAKRIVLFDTLIASLSEKELVSVLAHELGHFRKRHLFKSLFLSQIFFLAGLYLMSYVIEKEWVFGGLGLNVNGWSALLAIGLVLPRLTFWFSPFLGWFSRKNEFEADAYAKEIMGTGEALQSALITLDKENLGTPHAYPLFRQWHYSHPTVGERIEALDSNP